ncbi:TRAP transporter small permease [Castellaniella sp.]|uniref:TRAP transporter small permease n=1 Tax=Castellaniella sp. TaxID=1955812 RepID=UPI003C7601CA
MLAGINRCLDRIESFAMIVFMLVATFVAIIQVIARYVFNNSLYWSEETVLYALIMMSFLTCSMGVRYAAHICVEVLPLMVGPRMARVLQYLANVLGLMFAGVLVYYGARLAINTLNMNQLSPAMRIPVGYVYMVIPVSGACMGLRYLWILWCMASGKEYRPLVMDISAAA